MNTPDIGDVRALESSTDPEYRESLIKRLFENVTYDELRKVIAGYDDIEVIAQDLMKDKAVEDEGRWFKRDESLYCKSCLDEFISDHEDDEDWKDFHDTIEEFFIDESYSSMAGVICVTDTVDKVYVDNLAPSRGDLQFGYSRVYNCQCVTCGEEFVIDLSGS